jgi:general L-amino acid transport system substrate-binding protein
MMGKLVVSLIWVFWMMAMSSVEGTKHSLHDHSKMSMEERRAVQKIWETKNAEKLPEYHPTYGTTYNRVLEQGIVKCGTKEDFYGFSETYWDEENGISWKGFDVDICRAVAAAVFGDANRVEYVIVDGKTRFEYLIDGSIDMLSAATTYTFSRNVLKRLEFLPTTYYDGQGFMVRKTLGVSSAKQMKGARICYSSTGTGAKNIKDFFSLWEIPYEEVLILPPERPKTAYIQGKCDMYGTDASGLASNRVNMSDPEWHIILPEIISKEPLGPVVKYGDQKWSDIVRWSVYVLFIAEEYGITSENIDTKKSHPDPMVQRFMGEVNGADHPHLGAKLGLPKAWAYNIIKQVGNYKEIYERNIGPNTKLGLKRGLNQLYSNGGLLYAPPLK